MKRYELKQTDPIVTPALIYYKDIIQENLDKILRLAGGPERLWPHVKSHKSIDMVRMQRSKGIEKFKCATVAELEMVCQAGAEAAILAIAPAGPTPRRVTALMQRYPEVKIFAIVDCQKHLDDYAAAAAAAGTQIHLLLDINMGMNRTGVPVAEAGALFRKAAATPGLQPHGFHCYDGNRHEHALDQRQACVDREVASVFALRQELLGEGYDVSYMVMGGSPSFPCYLRYQNTPGIYYAPGTIFLNDVGYSGDFPDLDMTPAAAVLCRVISHPAKGVFTLDLGTKGIASDPPMVKRGRLLNVSHCSPVMHNEEHFVWQMDPGHEAERPSVGTPIYVIPYHVCPCAILYPSILVAEKGEIIGEWEVTARNRKINF